jgi:hypothetical protein
LGNFLVGIESNRIELGSLRIPVNHRYSSLFGPLRN